MRPTRSLIVAALLFISPAVFAAKLTGRVVHVADGDTVTVLDTSNMQHKIRVAGIDAPERRQPYGQISRKHLSVLVGGKSVIIEWHKRDRYGRVVGKILLDGRDVGLEQIRAGLAWHYKRYEREQSPEDRRSYAEAELAAKSGRIGLWRELDPMPPWQFRRISK